MVKFVVEFWWKMLLTISPPPSAKEARKSPSKLRRKFATNFAENFANFTLEIAGAYFFLFKDFLANLSFFPFFPKEFRGSASRRSRFGHWEVWE